MLYYVPALYSTVCFFLSRIIGKFLKNYHQETVASTEVL